MNKRQKAKYYKRMYETLIHKPAYTVVRTIGVQTETYKSTKVFDYPPEMLSMFPKDKDGIPFAIREEIANDFSQLIYNNLKIVERFDNPRRPNGGLYEAIVRIAWE